MKVSFDERGRQKIPAHKWMMSPTLKKQIDLAYLNKMHVTIPDKGQTNATITLLSKIFSLDPKFVTDFE